VGIIQSPLGGHGLSDGRVVLKVLCNDGMHCFLLHERPPGTGWDMSATVARVGGCCCPCLHISLHLQARPRHTQLSHPGSFPRGEEPPGQAGHISAVSHVTGMLHSRPADVVTDVVH